MSFFDKAKDAVSDAVDKHGNQIADGIDKVAEAADRKTGGKHADQIRRGATEAKDGLDRLDGKNDDIR